MLIACLAIAVLQDAEETYRKALAEQTTKANAADEEMKKAHAALDEGNFERAVEFAREAKRLREQSAAAKVRASAALTQLVPHLVELLESESVDARDRATRTLKEIGPPAIRHLLMARLKVKERDARARLEEILCGVDGDIRIDETGVVHQWAKEAVASSEYTLQDWSAQQARGAPDTEVGGDCKTAWAPLAQDAGEEWLELGYHIAVRITKVRVHETFTPGGIVSIDAIDEAGKRVRLWAGKDPGGVAPVWSEFETKPVVARRIVITLDTKAIVGWEEIDAVELVGEPVDE